MEGAVGLPFAELDGVRQSTKAGKGGSADQAAGSGTASLPAVASSSGSKGVDVSGSTREVVPASGHSVDKGVDGLSGGRLQKDWMANRRLGQLPKVSEAWKMYEKHETDEKKAVGPAGSSAVLRGYDGAQKVAHTRNWVMQHQVRRFSGVSVMTVGRMIGRER